MRGAGADAEAATIAAVGYAAHGLAGRLQAAGVAFVLSFSFILLAGRFERLRRNALARPGRGESGRIGAILGAAITLGGALAEAWHYAMLAAAAVALMALQRGLVPTLLAAGRSVPSRRYPARRCPGA